MSTVHPISVRETLRLSQTNVTPNPIDGLEYAARAFQMTFDPEVMQSDPTARAEAAAKAGFRAQQAGLDSDEVMGWFIESHRAIPVSREGRREEIGTRTLEGRSYALRLLNDGSKKEGLEELSLRALADGAFQTAEAILQAQHWPRGRWDRYGTMSARHHAAYEAIFGDSNIAARLAIKGVWRAARAETEGEAAKEHQDFVIKQMAGNAVAGALAASKPLNRFATVKDVRSKLARKLLG